MMRRVLLYGASAVLLAVYLAWRALRPDPLLIVLDGQGRIIVDGVVVDAAQLESRLREYQVREEDGSVIVSAVASLPAAQLMPVVESARAAGIADLQFETRP